MNDLLNETSSWSSVTRGLCVMAKPCNPSTWEAEADDQESIVMVWEFVSVGRVFVQYLYEALDSIFNTLSTGYAGPCL